MKKEENKYKEGLVMKKNTIANARFMLLTSCLSMLLAGCGDEAGLQAHASDGGNDDQKFELRMVSFLSQDHRFTRDVIPLYKEMIEEGTDGRVEIQWLGGSETIPPRDQFDAVSNGMVDMVFNAGSFYNNVMPVVDSMLLSPYSPLEERENGYYDFMVEQFLSHNVRYLGRWVMDTPFYLWTNKEVENISDLDGATFRSNPIYHEIFKELGIEPLNIAPGDVYTSLERGMVDGFGFPLFGPRESGWTEVTKYIIDAPFLAQNTTILMSERTYSSMPEDLARQVEEITREFELAASEYWEKSSDEEVVNLESHGVEFISIDAGEKESFQEIVREVKWSELEGRVSDEIYSNLLELLNN